MRIDEYRHGAVTVLRPSGPLVGEDAQSVLARVQSAVSESMGRIVIDAEGIAFVDSKGLESVLEASEQLENAGLALKLCGANETLREVLDLTGVGKSLEQYADVNSAVRSFM